MPEEIAPPGMVWVPGTGSRGLGKTMFPGLPVDVPGFSIDRHEVTNRQFQAFVEARGYQRREFWKHPFIKNGQARSWEQAMTEFRDTSGKAGPATWELGSYPPGKADYPVGGVSWYEAAAYADFAGKSLPTVHHWLHAAGGGMGAFFQVLEFSNFGGAGPAPAGAYRGLGPFGTYDMAGNVREWCWTPVQKFRYILGGGWNDPAYQLSFPNALDPFARREMNGFRCARYASPPPEALAGEVAFINRDRRGDTPASDDAYRLLRSFHVVRQGRS